MLNRALLPTASGVASSGAATIDMVLGQRLYSVCLELGDDGTSSGVPVTGAVGAGGLTQAQIELILDALIQNIEVKWNTSQVRQPMLASRINQLNGINGTRYLAITSGTAGTAGFRVYLKIFFAEYWRKNPLEVPALSLNLNPKDGAGLLRGSDGKYYGDTSSCQIIVRFNAVTAPVLTGYYMWEPADPNRGVGSVNSWIVDELSAAGAKNDFRIDRVKLIQSIHIWPSAEVAPKYISYFQLQASGLYVQERLSYLENQDAMYQFELQPDTSAAPRFDWVADIDDPILNALAASAQSSLRMYLEYSGSAAGNLPLVYQRIGTPQ